MYQRKPQPPGPPPEISQRRRFMLAIEEHAKRVGEVRVWMRGRLWTASSSCLARTVDPSKPGFNANEVAIPYGDLSEREVEDVLIAFREARDPVDPRQDGAQFPRVRFREPGDEGIPVQHEGP